MNLNPRKITTHIILLIATISIIVYFLPRNESKELSYEENRPWEHSMLRAPFEIYVYPDTTEVIDSINAAFAPICACDNNIIDSISKQLSNDKLLAQTILPILQNQYNAGVVNADMYNKIKQGILPTVRILQGKMLKKVSTANFMSPRQLYLFVDSLVQDSITRSRLKKVNLSRLLLPNMSIDEAKSQKAYNEDLTIATAPIGIIMQNERIIDRGEIVTPKHYRILKTYQEMLKERAPESNRSQWLHLMGQSFYVLILISLLYIYLHNFNNEIIYKKSNLLFILLLITAFSILASFTSIIFNYGIYLVPFVIIPIVILVFFDARTALFCHIIEILICASFTSSPLEFIVIEFCAGTAAIYSLKVLSKRSQLLRTALLVFLAYILSYISMEVFINGTLTNAALRVTGFMAINAVMTSFAYILIFIIEKLFGLISVVTLVELSDINNPLLRRLSEQCPGTFQHSMAVSNLAADAAGRINANVQLVRAGALYHDIGKLENPAFFTENQRGVNPHDALPPEKSAEIVIHHVTDGLKLAAKAKLPTIIEDFISQHHGRGKAKYFYITYCQNHPEETVNKALFTYPGPNPTSKETSILMMADSVEAASRSLSEHSTSAITELVNRIIDSQIEDGLHNDSPISFRDIKIIKEAFINRVSTMYHSRVVYPDEKNTPNQQHHSPKA